MSDPRNYLEPTSAERKKLRAQKIRLNETHLIPVKELMTMLEISKIRAMELSALSEFQSLPSVGIRFAYDLIGMGFYSMKELKNKNPVTLLHQYERSVGAWVDPCVEDMFRLVVHYADHPQATKNWWDFTAERKAYREKKGYPSDRPSKPWYQLDQYSTKKKVAAKTEVAKGELVTKLRRSIVKMKKELASDITIKDLAGHASLSQYHYIRCFRSAYDVTPLQFLTRLRLKKASLLLRKTKQPIQLIVPQCGFIDESSFGRLFKRAFRLTPMAFRAKAK